MVTCLNRIATIGCVGTILLIAVSIALAQQNGLAWTIGIILGFAVIGKLFFRA